MRKIFTIAKNELIRYFVSPLAYVYLFCFVMLNATFATYFGDFFNRGQADLNSMFMFQPWLYLLFIPGISMRLWAEEFHAKTIIQLATQPVSIVELVVGKFLAAWIFCGIALVLTTPFWLTVNTLGRPDNFVIFMGYCASFVLAGCMIAISQTMSALTKNQIIALVLAVIANLIFFWSGIEYVLSFCRLFLPNSLVEVIASFSFITHFNSITYGLLELRDIIFFASIIIFGNYTTILILNVKTAGTSGWFNSGNKAYNITAWGLLCLSFFGVNILANNLTANIQFDGTEDKNFTLTESSRKILRNLPEPVLAKLYFSPILEQRNPKLREHFNTIKLLLQKYKNASKGKFEYKIYYPKFLDDKEDIALADGVQPIPLIDLNQSALFGLTLENTLQNKEVIPFFAEAEHGRLEQNITSKIKQLSLRQITVGFISKLPVFGTESANSNILPSDPWQISTILKKNYNLVPINKPQDFDNNKIDVLVIFFPQNFDKEMIAKIKDFSNRVGKIMLVLDPANEATRLYSPVSDNLQASNLGELEQFWRIKLYNDYVVADLKNSVTVDATKDYAQNPVFSQDVIQFKIGSEDMNPNHPITKNLHEIMFASASIVMPYPDAYKEKRIAFYPLLRASRISEMVPAEYIFKGLNPQEILQKFEVDDNQKIIAAEVVGLEPDRKFDLIVVTDSDFLYDDFWMQKTRLLESEYVSEVFDNANFLLNSIDYLAGENSLFGLRGKRAQQRSFEGVEMLRRLNSLQYKKEEMQIFTEMDQAKEEIQLVWSKKEFENRENFTPEELAKIAQIRQRLTEFRQKLSDLRHQAYKDIKTVESRINFINIWLMPLIFATILLLLMLIKQWKRKQPQSVGFKINKRLLIMGASTVVILALAAISVYAVNYSSVDAYENKHVFPKIGEKLNEINVIELKSNKQSLTFERQNNLWTIKEMPDLPVYQDYVRRLLTTAADARYFARKSNKAENLAMFNLLPIEDENSGALKVTFKTNDETVQTFILGDINIDIGRGSKAAYIRFNDQFQVWEISADFVDISTDWHHWTYSNLWDLRFGRPVTEDNPQKQAYLLNLMRLLLNTPYEKVITKPQAEPLVTIRFNIEENNQVDLNFYQTDNVSYVTYDFAADNKNPHLKLLAQYLNNKACVIDNQKMEMLLNVIR